MAAPRAPPTEVAQVDRRDWYSLQVVSEEDLDGQEDAIEKAIADAHAAGVLGAYPISGLAASADGTTLVLSVTAGYGLATDATGRPRFVRLTAGATKTLSTAIPTTNPRWATLALKFIRDEHGEVVDGENVTLDTFVDESAELVILTGAENASPTKPSIPDDHVPLVDVRLTVGLTAIHPYHCDYVRTRPTWAKTTGGSAQQLSDIAGLQLNNVRGYVLEPQSSNAMKIRVTAGRFNVAGSSVDVTGGDVTLVAPSTPTLHYIALVYADADGALHADYGDETFYTAAPPSFEGRFPICTIPVTYGDVRLDPEDLVDVRPHHIAPRDVPNRYRFDAAGGEDAITIPSWTFVPGSNGLMVFKNGLLLDHTYDYDEQADGTGITNLSVALIGSDIVDLVAPRIAGTNPVTSHASTHGADGGDPIDHLGGLVYALDMGSGSTDELVAIRRFTCVISGQLRTLASPVEPSVSGVGAGAWGYCYGYMSGSTVSVEVSTTAPDTSRRFKTGDTSRTYLGAFRRTSTGKIRAFRRMGRSTRYFVDLSLTSLTGAANNLLMFSQTGDASAHDVSLAEGIPPHVTACEVAIDLSGNAGQTATVLGGGLSSTRAKSVFTQAASQIYQRMLVDTDALNQINVTASNGTLVMRGYLIGYDD